MVVGFAGIFGGKSAPVKQLQGQAVSAFRPLMKAAVHAPPVVSQKHAVGAKILSRGATYSPSLSTLTPTPTSPTSVDETTPSVIDTLKAALVQAGMDISGMQFTQHKDIVTYPGGSYVNDLISFQAANGQSHDYMTNLVSIAPQVTVTEIQHLMAGNRG